MKLSIKYKMLAHQKEFHNDLHSRFLHLSAGLGSGKSYALCMKAIKMRWLNKQCSGGLVAPSYPELKKDVIELMTQILEDNRIPYSYHQTDKVFSYPWCKGRTFCFTAEKKIRGPNLGDMGLNEVTLMSKNTFIDAVGRVRHKDAVVPQVYSSGTPEGLSNFIYELFIEKPMDKSRIIYGKTLDNLVNLDESYIESLKASYDKITLQAYLHGEWVNMNKNQFYYAYDSSIVEDRSIFQDMAKSVYVGLDFNVEHMTASCWNYYGEKEGIRGFDEVYLENNADTEKMGKALIARGYTPKNTVIFPDPAGASRSTRGLPDHKILENMGFEVRAKTSAPRFRERQLNMNNKLEKGWIKYNPDKMPKLRRDLLSVEQNPATLEKVKKDAKLTHASDGLDYLVDILSPLEKPNRSESVTFR